MCSGGVLEDPAFNELWDSAKADEGYQHAARAIAEKVPVSTLKTMNNHPVQAYK